MVNVRPRPVAPRAVTLAVTVLAGACSESDAAQRPSSTQAASVAAGGAREPIEPLRAPTGLDPAVVALGRRLFFEKALSVTEDVACSDCHDLSTGGDDGLRRSIGVHGQEGDLNAPTVLNAGLNFVQFWDGRAATLEAQIDGPIQHPREMGAAWPDILARLTADADYARAFETALAGPPTVDRVKTAIATFERTLVTVGSPFDRFLDGDSTALAPDARAGYDLFKSLGCVACHQGANVGGNMFQKFGVMGDYFRDRGDVREADHGRFNVTRVEADRFVFRVPSLRNVAMTAPYFHDGSAATLEDAVRTMARYQLGRPLAAPDVVRLIAFLESLSGEPPEAAP